MNRQQLNLKLIGVALSFRYRIQGFFHLLFLPSAALRPCWKLPCHHYCRTKPSFLSSPPLAPFCGRTPPLDWEIHRKQQQHSLSSFAWRTQAQTAQTLISFRQLAIDDWGSTGGDNWHFYWLEPKMATEIPSITKKNESLSRTAL